MKKFLSRMQVRWPIAIGCLGAFIFGAIIFALSSFIPSPPTSRFTSPSSDKAFLVVAGCGGIPCNNSAALITRTETEEAKFHTCDLRFQWDSIHFENTVVDWSDDEQTIYWKFGDQGSLIEIDVENDCQ